MSVNRLRDLTVVNSINLPDRIPIVKDLESEQEVTIRLDDLIALLSTVSPSVGGSKNYCYNPEFLIQQIRGEGNLDAATFGPIIDTANSKTEELWFCDGWAIKEIGFNNPTNDIEISHAVVEDITTKRTNKIQFTVDALPSGVPATDNLVNVSFILDNDDRKDLRKGDFTIAFQANFPRTGDYTISIKDTFSVYVTTFTIDAANVEQFVTVTIPANTQTLTGAQDTFIDDKFNTMEVGITLAGTKGALNTENISETSSDGYSTVASATIIDYFIKDTQVGALVVSDVFELSEFIISKSLTSYNGYDKLNALQEAERYFQKSVSQKIPAGQRFIAYTDEFAEFRFTGNAGSINDYINNAALENRTFFNFKNPLKTHDSAVVKVAINPFAIPFPSEKFTFLDAGQYPQGLVFNDFQNNGDDGTFFKVSFFNIGTLSTILFKRFNPPDGETLEELGKYTLVPDEFPDPAVRVSGWTYDLSNISPNPQPLYSYGKNKLITISPEFVTGLHCQWHVSSLPDFAGVVTPVLTPDAPH